MPKGPQGQKRPRDVVGAAVKSMRVLTGDDDEPRSPPVDLQTVDEAERDRLRRRAAKAKKKP